MQGATVLNVVSLFKGWFLARNWRNIMQTPNMWYTFDNNWTQCVESKRQQHSSQYCNRNEIRCFATPPPLYSLLSIVSLSRYSEKLRICVCVWVCVQMMCYYLHPSITMSAISTLLFILSHTDPRKLFVLQTRSNAHRHGHKHETTDVKTTIILTSKQSIHDW